VVHEAEQEVWPVWDCRAARLIDPGSDTPVMHFAAIHAHRFRSIDPDPNSVALDGDDVDLDVACDNDLFPNAAAENKHGFLPGRNDRLRSGAAGRTALNC
jgi:hypothetical protein